MDHCLICQKNPLNHLKVICNCGHILCEVCVIYLILNMRYNSLIENISQEHFYLKCKCSNGSIELPYEEYSSMIDNVHKQGLLDQHAQLCEHHQKTKDIYCKDCRYLICQQCLSKEAKHYDHKYINEQVYLNKERDKLKYRKYQSYKEFNDVVEKLESDTLNTLDKESKEEEEIITKQLQELTIIKQELVDSAIRQRNNIAMLFNMIKKNGMIYYNEYEKDNSFQSIQFIKTHKEEISSVKYSYDNKNIITEMTKTIEQYKKKLLDNATIDLRVIEDNSIKKPSKTFIGHKGTVYSVIQISNSQIASCSDDHTIKIWNIDNCTCVDTLINHTNSITSIIQLEDKRLVSCSDDNTINIWQFNPHSCTSLIAPNNMTIFSIVEVYSNVLASSSNDKSIKLWDLTSTKVIKTLKGHTDAVYSIIKVSLGRLGSCSGDKTIKIWNIDRGECEMTLVGHEKAIYSLCEYQSGKIASASGDSIIKLWTINGKENIGDDGVMKTCRSIHGHQGGINALAKIDERHIASGGDDHIIKIWNVETLMFTNVFMGYKSAINGIIVLKNGNIVSCSSSDKIKLWEM